MSDCDNVFIIDKKVLLVCKLITRPLISSRDFTIGSYALITICFYAST